MANATPQWRKIKQEIESFSSVVIACSGGVDSIFLLDFASRCDVKAVVAYFDHDLGNGDTNFVKKQAEHYYFPFVSAKGVNIDKAASVEAEARAQRYEFLSDVKSKFKYEKVLTGHHLNDQVETVLLRLLRGYDHSSLGMKKDNGLVYRPFLDVPKSKIVEQAKNKQLTWIEDDSNLSPDFERNFLRNEIIPKLMKGRNIEKTVVKGLGK